MSFCCWKTPIEIEIANGSEEALLCRVNCDRTLVKRQAGGAGVNVVGVAGLEANAEIEYEHRVGGSDGYTVISPGNKMSFDTTGTPAYITIISEKDHKVCVNHKVNKNRNFIVSKGLHLKESSQANIWIATSGEDYSPVINKNKPRKTRITSLLDPVELFDTAVRSKSVEHKGILIANGSNEIIYCRVDVIPEERSFSSRGNNNNHSNKDGQTPIPPNSYLKFTPTRENLTMTIISKSFTQICVHHEVQGGSGFIVSSSKFLKDAVEGEIWIDTAGINHQIINSKLSTENVGGSFNPLSLFSITSTSETNFKKEDLDVSINRRESFSRAVENFFTDSN